MTEQQNTPELRFPEFNEEWHNYKISHFLKESRIKGNLGSKAKKLTVKLWGKGVVPKQETFKGSDNTQYYIRKSGQLMYGKLDFLNCAFGIVPVELNNFESTIDSPSFDFIDGSPKFLLERIKMKSFYKKFGDIANGSRKAKRINQETFLSMPIYSPTYEEQLKIGNFFSKLDHQIELEEEKLELLEQQKKGYMQKIFSQELRFKDEKGGTYPNWKNEALGSIVKITMGQSPSSKNYTENSSYTILVQGNADLNNGCIKPRIYTKQVTKLAEVNDILLTVRAPVGKIGRAQLKACIGRGVCAIKGDIFIYYFLELFDLQNKWIKFSQGSTFESISGNEIKSIDIAYPTNEERQKISKFLSKLDELLKNQLLKIELLKQRKQGLLQKMFV